MTSICIVACYIGKLPPYFNLFLTTCYRNSGIDFIIINDKISNKTQKNVKFISLNLKQLNSLASKKLNLTINFNNSWKINELKPAFGVLFVEQLRKYDFWGWCDIDIIFGNILNFLTESRLKKYDIITTREHWTTGHFTLLRNTEFCNKLYEQSPSYKEILEDNQNYYAFEEACKRWDGIYYPIDELVKKKMPVSMYDIIKNLQQQNKLRALFRNMIREHPHGVQSPFLYMYKKGILYDLKSQEEFMYFHLITLKKIWRFYIQPWKIIPPVFFISPLGLYSDTQARGLAYLVWHIQRISFCAKGISISIKKQKPKYLLLKLLNEIKNLTKFIFR